MSWSAVHIYFLIGIRNRLVVALAWLWGYVTFKRGAHLIMEVPRSFLLSDTGASCRTL
jgi:NADH dehydrogenase